MRKEYPEEISLIEGDFSWQEVKEALEKASNQRLHSYWTSLSRCADKAIQDDNLKTGKILWLLADSCSMRLQPESINNPFIPITGGCNITAHIDMFESEEIKFLESIIPLIENYKLKARIADLVWLSQKPRKVENALSAIDSYFLHPLSSDSWASECAGAWERGLRLALMLRYIAEKRIDLAKQEILKKLAKTGIKGKFFGLKLAELLVLTPLDEEQEKLIKEKLSKIAEDGATEGNYHLAREYNEFLFRLKKHGEEEKKWKIRAKIAELWVKEAEAAKKDNKLATGHWYEVALIHYRVIPVSFRDDKIIKRMKDLHRLMNEANQEAIAELTEFQSPEVNISDQISVSRNHVSNRKFPEVLLYFAHILKPIKAANVEKSGKEMFNSSIFRRIMSSTHLTSDGRVVARTGGIDVSNPDSEDLKQAYWHEMVQLYTWEIELLTRACIFPGIKIINLEHRITEADLRVLCTSSSIIPQSRVGLWAKGLFYGFENDFSVASHLLCPQIENLVRLLLKQNEVKTSTIDAFGIENECSLSTLLDREKAKEILGEDLHFELKALLADQLGPNLRNNIAHGLLETGYGTSLPEIYFWWFCLRLMVLSVAWKKENESES